MSQLAQKLNSRRQTLKHITYDSERIITGTYLKQKTQIKLKSSYKQGKINIKAYYEMRDL